ncbi:MAG: FAD-binding and (Fe-S)-binding domain-containing protein [Anaerolineaceae bacterium]|nr:FAD-binding and (Fe-S)-binding domain-containing protein [Anaerolineaceae bacterium]
MDQTLARLQAICGNEHVTNEKVDLLCYRRDCGPTPGGVPAYVCRPETTAEVIELVGLANEIKKPLFLWGRATTFVDNGVANGCIVLALDLMNKFEIDLSNQVVHAETGAIWHAIDAELKKQGWELSAPGGGGMFSASVGGTIAYNAVPHGITEYGVTGDHVVAMEVVLPDGTLIHTGSAANDANGNIAIERGANGPDLGGLFIGSCGTMGVITKATLQIRRIPEEEAFLFYTFDRLDDAVDAVSSMQSQASATFIIGLFGGPKPTGVPGNYSLHMIIRDSSNEVQERRQACKIICESHHGMKQDAGATGRYWTEHMYSWLRNDAPSTYYGSRPYYCPEVAGFVPTQSLKEIIPALNQYIDDTSVEWNQNGMRVKGFDVYFSRNGGFLWVDTLYNESKPEVHQYGLKVRRDIANLLFSKWMSPGGIVAGLAPYIMPKLGTSYQLMQTLKDALDKNHILNPGVLMLAGDPTFAKIPDHSNKPQGLELEKSGDTTYQCLRCGFCFDVSWVGKDYQQCPSYEYGSFESYMGRGRMATARAILEGELDYDEKVAERIFSCTLCGSCGDHCLKQIDTRKIYQYMRDDMATRGLTPPGLKKAAEETYRLHNPYAKEDGDRFKWLKDKTHLDRQAKTAVFVGCTPSYIKRSTAGEAIELLEKLGVDFTIASSEWCCAHPLMSAGEHDKAVEFMRHNIETYQTLGVEQMVFLCPGCQMTFSNELPEVLGEALPFRSISLVEWVAGEIEAGRIEMRGMPGASLTYHDPCTLGRQLGVYDAPRTILKSIPGAHYTEMPRNKVDSFCCGAGAFVRYDFPELTDSAGLQRWNEARRTGASLLITACTSCLSEFQLVKSQTKDNLEVADLISLVNKQVVVKETVSR